MDIKKITAEGLGTFILTLAVCFSLAGTFPVPTPVIAALSVGMGVYALGHVSGAHFNPAITLGILAIRKISPQDAAAYLAAQFAGVFLAHVLAQQLVTVPTLIVADSLPVIAGEFLGALAFATGVAAAVHGKISAGASGLVVGGSLLLGVSIAAALSNGVLNPAVALGIGSFSASYGLAPIAGAVLAMILYKRLFA